MTRRILGAVTAASLLLALVAGTTVAGGWATISADAEGAGTTEPKAGQEIRYGFTVLQHGRTPAGWVTPVLTLTEAATGKTFTVTAAPKGAVGHFVADITYPSSGIWTMSVSLTDLIVESQPTTAMVRTADGAVPAFDPAIALTAIAQAKRDILAEVGEATYPRLDSIDTQLLGMRSEMSKLARERDEMATRLAAIESGTETGLPVVGIVAIAVLAGALAGFALTWLGRRSEPDARKTATSPVLTTGSH